jgi:hypothetical protein
MNLIAVLNALHAIHESLPVLRRTYSEIPAALNADELPAAAISVGEATHAPGGRVGAIRVRRQLQTYVFIAPVSQARQQQTAYDVYSEIVSAIVAAYLQQRNLVVDGQVVAHFDMPISDSGPQVTEVAGAAYLSAVITYHVVSL